MKSFSALRDTQRGSLSYMEKRRGSGQKDGERRVFGGVRRGRDCGGYARVPREQSVGACQRRHPLKGRGRVAKSDTESGLVESAPLVDLSRA